MSINQFHIVFISVSSLFMLYFLYWSYSKWQAFNDSSYLFYMMFSILCFLALFIYSKNFLKKTEKL